MHFSNDEYKKTMKCFLDDHHGQIIKLKDESGRIFSYIVRCETNPRFSTTIENNQNMLLSFGISFDMFYINLRTGYEPNAKELKYYAIKRMLEKWKNVKEDSYVKYKDCLTDEFNKHLVEDVKCVKEMYDKFGIKREFDVQETANYIHKILKLIKNYYKNENIDEFNLILL